MVIIRATDFKQHQKKYLDMIDEGEEVILFRGKGKSYRIISNVSKIETREDKKTEKTEKN